MSLTDFNILPELVKGIHAMGFTAYMPIQLQAIPPGLEGKDVLGSAQTGSGKTVAFVLPLLDKMLRAKQASGQPHKTAVRAIILVPTRELAAQVETAVRDLARFTSVKCVLIIGGTSYHNQVQALKQGAEIVVATPGRLLDHYRSNTIHFRDVRTAVLDEADRMLDMGFMPDIRRIMSSLPKDRQTLMFSATIPPEVERVVGEFMRSPVRIEVDRPRSTAAGITQMIYPVPAEQKYDLLHAILKNTQIASAVIFTRTKHRADRVARYLEGKGIRVAVLHSNRSQAQRTQAMDAFRDKKNQLLVATDIAARGIDVKHISHVVNFDVPTHAEDYVHRIGRTGRAFTVGDAYTLMDREEEKFIAAIEQFIGATIPRCAFPDFPYKVAPLLKAYKPPVTQHFRMRRTIARSSRMRFRR
jgi:ATP-dependent RNA helicase RhlE